MTDKEKNDTVQQEEVEYANINADEEVNEDVVEEVYENEESDESEVLEEADINDNKEASDKSKKFFKKEKKKDPKDAQIEELLDKTRRQMAEFDNFRKRTEKEKSAMYEIGAKDIIERILPVVDNFERGFSTLSEDEKASPFAEGMEKVFKQLTKALEEAGVKPIEALGKPFDPNFHNAVMHIEDDTLEENVVADEFQKGYTYRDSVIRHSMVKVAN